jgi:hypothetical protein
LDPVKVISASVKIGTVVAAAARSSGGSTVSSVGCDVKLQLEIVNKRKRITSKIALRLYRDIMAIAPLGRTRASAIHWNSRTIPRYRFTDNSWISSPYPQLSKEEGHPQKPFGAA